MGERAQVAWALRETLPEFDERPQEQQEWAIATWRMKNKMDAIQVAELWERRK